MAWLFYISISPDEVESGCSVYVVGSIAYVDVKPALITGW